MCPSQNQQQRSTTSTYSPTSSTSNLAYHHPQSSSQELLKVDDAHSFMDRSMNNPADISKPNNDLTTGNQNVDTSSSSSLPQSAVFNPAMMMMLQQQQQQQFHADNFSALQDVTSGTFAPSSQQSIDATDVSSMLFSLSNDMNNGIPSSYNHDQDQQVQQQVQQQQVNQLPPTAMVQAFQDHQLHHQGGMNPAMNTIGSSSGTINDHTGNVMSMSNNQNTTSAGNFVETNPQQQQQMQMQSMASMMPTIPPAIAQQLLVQLQQQGPAALPSIALLTNSLGSTVINNPAATQHQQQLPPAQPSSSSAAVAVASASATGVPPPPKKVGRRGDPRMHEAVRYRLAHPKCTLLDALLHGGFSFPPLHLVNISDRFVKDANGVTLSQRKNQLMRRLRVIEKGEESNDANKKKKKKKKKKKNEEADNVKSTTNSSDDTSKSGDDASSDSDCSGNVGIDAPAVPSSSVTLPPQQVQVPAMPDTTAVMVPSLPTSSSEGQGQGSEMEQQIRNQLLINQLKMVLLQQQIQEQAQAQVQNQQGDQQQQQQQMTADETLMSLQTDTSASTEERAADERNAKSA